MTRFASATNEAEASQRAIGLATLVELDFVSGVVRASDWVGELTYGGNTYSGVGEYGGIETVTEDAQVIARPLRITLSGVDNSLLATARDEVYQGRSATVYVGLVDMKTNQFLDAPEEIWSGKMDTMSISLGPKTGTLTLNCEHRLRREPRIARYTDADQQLVYANDRFFDTLPMIEKWAAQWGSENAVGFSGGAGNSTGIGQSPIGGGFVAQP